MSTEAVSTSQTVQFPAKATIIEYMKGHSMAQIADQLNLPDTFAEIAKWFAQKERPRQAIRTGILEVLVAIIEEAGSEEQKRYVKLNDEEKKIVREADVGPMALADEQFMQTVSTCTKILEDCIDHRTSQSAPTLEKRVSLPKKPRA